jgi:glycosyltransferase involved in cell wall biosynthesis
MNTSPLVSVIIPAYNADHYIRQTIESVLAQTYSHIEVLVVDDGSTDATPEIVEQFSHQDQRVILLQQANAGVAAARNLAIAQSHGEFIAPLDADDIWYPQKLEKQVNCFIQSDQAVGLVYTWSVLLDENGQQLSYCQSAQVEGDVLIRLIFENSPGNASSPLIRRSCLMVIGGYDCYYRTLNAQGCEDWDLYLRIAERYEFRVVPECLVGYRQVLGSMSCNPEPMVKAYGIIITSLEQRHPDIPTEFYRWSIAHFNWYIALKCSHSGDYMRTVQYLYQSVRLDSLYLLHINLYRITLSSLVNILLKSITVLFWRDHAHWEKSCEQPLPSSQKTELKPFQEPPLPSNRKFPRNYFDWLLNRRITDIEQKRRKQMHTPIKTEREVIDV